MLPFVVNQDKYLTRTATTVSL